VVFVFFANCPLSGAVRRRDPTLQSAIFVLEHATGEQRKWQLQDPNYCVAVWNEYMAFGTGLSVCDLGYLWSRSAPEFGMTDADASFISLKRIGTGGLFRGLSGGSCGVFAFSCESGAWRCRLPNISNTAQTLVPLLQRLERPRVLEWTGTVSVPREISFHLTSISSPVHLMDHHGAAIARRSEKLLAPR
jgi:hypothetical protein